MKAKKEISKIINDLRANSCKEILKAVDDIYNLIGWLPIEHIETNDLFDKILNKEVRLFSPSTGIIVGRLRKYLNNENVGYEWYYGSKGSHA